MHEAGNLEVPQHNIKQYWFFCHRDFEENIAMYFLGNHPKFPVIYIIELYSKTFKTNNVYERLKSLSTSLFIQQLVQEEKTQARHY